MDLTDAQKQSIRQWAAEGCGLSEIQKKILTEFGLSLTYMDVRLLAIDLGLALKEKSSRSATIPDMNGTSAADRGARRPDSGDFQAGKKSQAAASGIGISVDRVTAPGAVVSGSVTFSDGVKAAWFIDQFGQFGLNPDKPGYEPSRADVLSFRKQLGETLAKMGY